MALSGLGVCMWLSHDQTWPCRITCGIQYSVPCIFAYSWNGTHNSCKMVFLDLAYVLFSFHRKHWHLREALLSLSTLTSSLSCCLCAGTWSHLSEELGEWVCHVCVCVCVCVWERERERERQKCPRLLAVWQVVLRVSIKQLTNLHWLPSILVYSWTKTLMWTVGCTHEQLLYVIAKSWQWPPTHIHFA